DFHQFPPFAVAAKPKGSRGRLRQERGGLADEVHVAIGMEVMVTFDVSTGLDMANGARGHIEEIVLDAREEVGKLGMQRVHLEYPPCYILVHMNRTKAEALDGLPIGVLPIAPLTRSFTI
ncbi:hypothetical protein M404DRAFT_100727, partial [Pisolithus tinctorius Marx 270]